MFTKKEPEFSKFKSKVFKILPSADNIENVAYKKLIFMYLLTNLALSKLSNFYVYANFITKILKITIQ